MKINLMEDEFSVAESVVMIILHFLFSFIYPQNSQKTKSHFNEIDILEDPKNQIFSIFLEILRSEEGFTGN